MPALGSAFSTTNKWLLKWPGLRGLPFYAFFFSAAAQARAIDPDAGLIDYGGEFYSGFIETAIEDFIPGAMIVLGDVFSLAAGAATDYIVPGASIMLGSGFNENENIGNMAPALEI